MTKIKKQCLICLRDFYPLLKDVKRGRAKYCSLSCSNSSRKKEKEPNETCTLCGKRFYIRPYNRINSKSGLHFCSRKCKDTGQSTIKEIQPYHYGKGKIRYRIIAKENLERKCASCGYDEIPQIIHVHHKDHDRNNNDISNLEYLCPNCHLGYHYLYKQKFKKKTKSVTV